MGRLAAHLTAMGDAPSALVKSRSASASPGGTGNCTGSLGEAASPDTPGDVAQELADALCANFAKQVRSGWLKAFSLAALALAPPAPMSATAGGVQPGL